MWKIAGTVAAVAAAGTLAGCASPQTFARAMSYVQTVHRVEMPDDTYRVFDHPTENVVMTSPSIGRAMAAGAATGATLGLADPFTPEQLHEAAARKHLDQTGRAHCEIVSGYLMAEPQYEFTYECPGQPG